MIGYETARLIYFFFACGSAALLVLLIWAVYHFGGAMKYFQQKTEMEIAEKLEIKAAEKVEDNL